MPTEKVYAQPQRGHVSLGSSLRALLFVVPVILLGLVLYLALRPMTEARVTAAAVVEVVFAILWGILVSGVARGGPVGAGRGAQAGQVPYDSRTRDPVYHPLY